METTYRSEAQCPLVNVHNKQYIYLYRSIHTNIQKYKANLCFPTNDRPITGNCELPSGRNDQN